LYTLKQQRTVGIIAGMAGVERIPAVVEAAGEGSASGSEMSMKGNFHNFVRHSLNRGAREMGSFVIRSRSPLPRTSTGQGKVFNRTISEAATRLAMANPPVEEVPKKSQKAGNAEDQDVPERLKYFLDQRKINFLRQQFHQYDADASGAISVDELQVFLKDSLGVMLNEDKLTEIIESVNPDNSEGLLTFRDFVLVWYQYCSDKDSKDKIIQMAFEFLDKDDSKSISVDEFTEAMTTVGDPLTLEECKLFYQLLNKGKTQELTETEFDVFMREHLEAPLPIQGAGKADGGVVHYLLRYLTVNQ